ncbi:unnamed protein product [Amoebophrya sp. A25]|nr:unnamed protein product [Amoebophrya sp. A25]|eukprot:GSA25T00014535001.1
MVDSCAGGWGGDAAFSLKYFKVDETTDGEPPKFVGAPKDTKYLRLPAADGNTGAEYDETVKDDCGDDATVVPKEGGKAYRFATMEHACITFTSQTELNSDKLALVMKQLDESGKPLKSTKQPGESEEDEAAEQEGSDPIVEKQMATVGFYRGVSGNWRKAKWVAVALGGAATIGAAGTVGVYVAAAGAVAGAGAAAGAVASSIFNPLGGTLLAAFSFGTAGSTAGAAAVVGGLTMNSGIVAGAYAGVASGLGLTKLASIWNARSTSTKPQLATQAYAFKPKGSPCVVRVVGGNWLSRKAKGLIGSKGKTHRGKCMPMKLEDPGKPEEQVTVMSCQPDVQAPGAGR